MGEMGSTLRGTQRRNGDRAAGSLRPPDQIQAGALCRADIGEEAIDVATQRRGLTAELFGGGELLRGGRAGLTCGRR